MKKVIILFLLISISFLSFTTSVSAEPKICYYSSKEKTGGYYEYAELTIYDSSNSIARVKFEDLQAPKLDCNVAADILEAGGAAIGGLAGVAFCGGAGGLICAPVFGAGLASLGRAIGGGKTCAFKANGITINDLEDRSAAASKFLNTKLQYFDANKNQPIVSLPNIDLGPECPKYLGVVISDISDANNVQVYAGDSSTKDFIDSYIKSNPDYNYVIWGTEFERTGEPGDGSNLGNTTSQDDSDLNTCRGLLGNKVNGEYQNGTVGALLQQIFDYMKMAAVILVFAFSVIDYAKAIAAQNQDAFKKANINFMKRIIFGIVFFLIPTLINVILSVIDSSTCGIQ